MSHNPRGVVCRGMTSVTHRPCRQRVALGKTLCRDHGHCWTPACGANSRTPEPNCTCPCARCLRARPLQPTPIPACALTDEEHGLNLPGCRC